MKEFCKPDQIGMGILGACALEIIPTAVGREIHRRAQADPTDPLIPRLREVRADAFRLVGESRYSSPDEWKRFYDRHGETIAIVDADESECAIALEMPRLVLTGEGGSS